MSSFLLNATYIQKSLEHVAGVAGAAPRWTILGRIGNRFDSNRNSTAVILVIDSEKEKALTSSHGLGISLFNSLSRSIGDWAGPNLALSINGREPSHYQWTTPKKHWSLKE